MHVLMALIIAMSGNGWHHGYGHHHHHGKPVTHCTWVQTTTIGSVPKCVRIAQANINPPPHTGDVWLGVK